jgi:hypothetical protein
MWIWYPLAESSGGWVGALVYFGGHAVLVVAFRHLGRKAQVPLGMNPRRPEVAGRVS